jgi:hypothetical protein
VVEAAVLIADPVPALFVGVFLGCCHMVKGGDSSCTCSYCLPSKSRTQSGIRYWLNFVGVSEMLSHGEGRRHILDMYILLTLLRHTHTHTHSVLGGGGVRTKVGSCSHYETFK